MPFWKKDPVKKEIYTNVAEGLRQVYKSKLLPLEETYRFHEFHSPQLDDSDFSAKPMVLLVGQYSVGKTTFIRYLLNVNQLFSILAFLTEIVQFCRKTFRAFGLDQVSLVESLFHLWSEISHLRTNYWLIHCNYEQRSCRHDSWQCSGRWSNETVSTAVEIRQCFLESFCLLTVTQRGARNSDIHRHAGYPRRREATRRSWLWIHSSSRMVCRSLRSHIASLRCLVAGHLRRVETSDRSPSTQRWQNTHCVEQSRFSRSSSINASLWCSNVVLGQSIGYTRSVSSLRRIILVEALNVRFESTSIWVGNKRSIRWFR